MRTEQATDEHEKTTCSEIGRVVSAVRKLIMDDRLANAIHFEMSVKGDNLSLGIQPYNKTRGLKPLVLEFPYASFSKTEADEAITKMENHVKREQKHD